MFIRMSAFVFALVAGFMIAASAHAQPYGGGGYYGNQSGDYGGEVIECRSSGYNYQRCGVPWRDARIVRQLSDTQCQRGRNWGFDPRGGFVWVDRGCSAQFVEGQGGGYGGGYGGQGGSYWQPGPDWNSRFEISCASSGYRYSFCAVDVGGGGSVRIARQTSNAACIEGQTWGWNRGGVWVDQGCGGEFLIDRRWR